ncbi:MAG: S8 family peptidase [Clostridiales bacterium]|nr:S8 family peptidase [Clostridiales bacterium]
MNHIRTRLHAEHTGGLTGRGVGVAVLDTGCFPHEDFSDRISAFYDIVHRQGQTPYDDNGHGTHVCGIIAGSGLTSGGRFAGIAPGCHLIPVKVLDQKGNGFSSDMITGLRLIRQKQSLYHIRIINISIGSLSGQRFGEDSALVNEVNAAWDDGLIIVAAAGNMGPDKGSVTAPGISRKVITVGSSDDCLPVNVQGKRMIHYSGRGPTGSCICKPDIVAPGAMVASCANRSRSYTVKSGTSMSTPIVTGAIALLLERHPNLTNRDIKLLLRNRAVDLGLPQNQQGWGMLDIRRLLATE